VIKSTHRRARRANLKHHDHVRVCAIFVCLFPSARNWLSKMQKKQKKSLVLVVGCPFRGSSTSTALYFVNSCVVMSQLALTGERELYRTPRKV
jgi:hypothetical protein